MAVLHFVVLPGGVSARCPTACVRSPFAAAWPCMFGALLFQSDATSESGREVAELKSMVAELRSQLRVAEAKASVRCVG